MTKTVSRNFRIAAEYSEIDISRFNMAIHELIAHPPGDNSEILTMSNLSENVIQKKVRLSESEWETFDKLKKIFHIEHDYELVNMILTKVKKDSFYSTS